MYYGEAELVHINVPMVRVITIKTTYFNDHKEVWRSRGSVPASGPPGPGSIFGPGPPHSVV